MALLCSPLLLGLVLWLAYTLWRSAHDLSAPIPAEIDVAEVLFDENRFADGCELVVYRMTEAARADLQRRGLAKLATAQASRDRPSVERYASWRKANAKAEVRGTDCIELPAELSRRIHRARGSSYVTEGRKSDLMADPQSGLVVYSYDGR